MGEADFTREDVEAAAGTRPWHRRAGFADEIDPESMAETAARYARAAGEAGDAGDLAGAATRAAEEAGHRDGAPLVDGAERIDATALGLDGDGDGLQHVTDLLVRAMNRALDAKDEVDALIDGPDGLEAYYRERLAQARAELAAPVPLLTGGDTGTGTLTPVGGDPVVPAVPGGGLSRPLLIRLRHLNAVVERARHTGREVDEAIAAYRQRLADYGAELDDAGYDTTTSPLDLWATAGMARFAADRITEALRDGHPDPDELTRWTRTLDSIGARLHDPFTGRPRTGLALTAAETAYLESFYDRLGPRGLAALGALADGPLALDPVRRTPLLAALGRVADGIVLLTDPALGGSMDRLPGAARAYLGVNDAAELPPRDTGGLERARFEEFGRLMATASYEPGNGLARELGVQRAVVALWAGADAGDGERPSHEAALRDAFAAMDPADRAGFWRAHRDELVGAGLLSAPPDDHADEGAGPHGALDPGIGDYALQAQLRAGSSVLDAAGKPDAARLMDHYLRGLGTPVEVDADRMLRDSERMRSAVGAALQRQQPAWATEAGKAFEESGGRPVALPVRSAPRGVRLNDDDNWFLAVGAVDIDVAGTVTVEAGPDGRPHARLDYQVNVWDRYNWDEGKVTEIGPFTFHDSDVGRLHATGLAQEFDVTGRSSVVSVPLPLDPRVVAPDPGDVPDPGRDGTRADPGRNGDAR